jgi:hydrophobic/amphiphilic exporter-1 (mainly G- bacteria), HAE1 family
MNISEPYIRRPVMTSLVMAGILFFGFVAYRNLPISDLPEIALPVITVTAQNPGMDAQTMANDITTILEQQLMTIQGLSLIVSTSSSGLSQIVCQFNLDRHIDACATDVSQALTQAQGNLPPDMPNPPQYKKTNPSDVPVMYIAVSSNTMTTSDLYDYGNTIIAQRMSMISGVSQVQIYGSQRATRVQLNPDAMAAMGLGIDTVSQAVQNANQQLAVGQVYDKQMAYTLYPYGQITNGEDYDPVIVEEREGAPIRIKDIGKGINGDYLKDYFLSLWTKDRGEIPSIVVAVTKQSGFNTVKLCNTIRNLLPELGKELPPSISLYIIHDGSIVINESISDVKFTLFLAFLLVVLVIFLFLGKMTTTFIPSIALPMAIFGTFALMYVNGYSMDILSMLALTLVVGFLVDDAIVVLENIVRHAEMGKKPLQAALDGSKQISTTVLSMTLSLSSVFIPLIFMPGVVGRMFHEFALVIVIAVMFSGFISLTLTPMLCSKFLAGKTKSPSRLENFANGLMDKLLKMYEPKLEWVVKHRWVPVVLVAISFALALYLFKAIPQDFLPAGDTGSIQGLTQAPQNVSLLEMKALQNAASNAAKKNPHIESIISAANITNYLPPNQGVLFFNLKPENTRPPINVVLKQINEELKKVVGINAFLQPIPTINLNVGTGVQRANYQYSLSTIENPGKLYEEATKLLNEMKKFPELENISSDIQDNTPQLNIKILRDQASTYGITAKTIEEALSLGYGGGRVSWYNTPINFYNIIIEMEDRYRLNPDALNKLYLTSTNPATKGQLVPLNTVVDITKGVGPMQVNHVNQLTSATIYFNVKQNAALGNVVKKIDAAADKILAPSVIRQFQGTAQVFEQTMKSMGPLLLTCILVIYLLLGSLYESYLHPITIFSTLPGAIFGGLLTLFVFNSTLSLYAYVGLIVLIGIVMKNGIMLVEFANELVENGASARDAIIDACKKRFRPILMTTVAAAMGAVPIAIGVGADASSRRPLGLIIVGGLIFAQLITYFFTPVVYLFIEEFQEKFFKKKQEE